MHPGARGVKEVCWLLFQQSGSLYLTANCAVPCRPRSGALRGASAPLSIPALVKELGIEGLASLQALVPSLVEELAAEGERQGACTAREGRMCMRACPAGACEFAAVTVLSRALLLPLLRHVILNCPCVNPSTYPPPLPSPGSVSGKLAAGGTSWVPSSYVAAQQDAVRTFFQQNGYIGYDTVRFLLLLQNPAHGLVCCWCCNSVQHMPGCSGLPSLRCTFHRSHLHRSSSTVCPTPSSSWRSTSRMAWRSTLPTSHPQWWTR